MPVLQQKLPPLPLPPLKQTLERFLISSQPFLNDEEFETTRKLAEDFSKPGGEGEKLQEYLKERVRTKENWLADLWLNHAYLEYRNPLPIYSSTGNIHPFRKFNSKSDQIAFAAAAVAGILDFKEKLYNNGIATEKLGHMELDMQQYYNFIGSCRIPGEIRDSHRFMNHDDPSSIKHIILAHNEQFFCIPVYDDNGKVLNQSQIAAQIQKAVAKSPEKSKFPVGIFTTEQRDTWYKIRSSLIKDAQNATNIDLIEKSLVLICLEGGKSPSELAAPNPYSASALKTFHGGGSKGHTANRWWDKSLQIVVSEDGEFGSPFEHGMGEGNPVAYLMDCVDEYCVKKSGKNDPVPPATSTFSEPQLLQFNISDDVERAFKPAFEHIDRIVEDVDLYALDFNDYGKGFIKTQNVSPDSYFQMAIQYAFYKQYKIPGAQYEAAATRIFKHGRTETIRSCSNESLHFARSMLNPDASSKEKATALRNAISAHKKYVGIAVEGQGVDRHLLGLRLMAKQHGMEEPKLFKDPAYVRSTNNMRLSTSQVVMKCDAFIFFGPLVPNGYGCCYTIREHAMTAVVTAFNSCEETNAAKFSQTLASCLRDMKAMLMTASQL